MAKTKKLDVMNYIMVSVAFRFTDYENLGEVASNIFF